MYIGYYILFIFIILLIIKYYIYKKYGFWYYQPVFHYYDIKYWLFSIGVINKTLPKTNKFCNFYNVKSFNFIDIPEKEIEEYIDFIQKFYYNKNGCKYLPTKEKFITYFESNNKKSIISLYEKDFLQAIITSRNINITLNHKTLQAYYVDNLCVHRMYRKEGIAPQIIQTHEYNQAHMNNSYQVSLFKREGELTGIVPLTSYPTKQYKIIKDFQRVNMMNSKNLIKITHQNINLLINFIYENKDRFSCVILPDISCLINLIKKETYYVYGILDKDKLLACYFFKDSEMIYEDDQSTEKKALSTEKKALSTEKKALDFFASINNTDQNLFLNTLNNILKKFTKEFDYLTIEYTSDNIEFVDYFSKSLQTINSPTAYFLYNYVIKPIDAKKCFIII